MSEEIPKQDEIVADLSVFEINLLSQEIQLKMIRMPRTQLNEVAQKLRELDLINDELLVKITQSGDFRLGLELQILAIQIYQKMIRMPRTQLNEVAQKLRELKLIK